MPKDYGTFSAPAPNLSQYSFTSGAIRKKLTGNLKALSGALDDVLDFALLEARLAKKKLLVLLGERHGVRLDLWVELFVLDALRRQDHRFDVIGVELSARGLLHRRPNLSEIKKFARRPAEFLDEHDLNVDALMVFGNLTGWAFAGCEPNQESARYGKIDFDATTPVRHHAFALRNMVTIRRLLSFQRHMVYTCGIGHWPDLLASPFLARQFLVLPICASAPENAAYLPQKGNLVSIDPSTTAPGAELVVGYLKKKHPKLAQVAASTPTFYVADPN